jgi:dTDP-4-amino-4,6-dideoxygalactose transaminase
LLTVVQPIIPDFEKFTSYLRLAFDERRFTNGGPLVSLLELRLRELIRARNLVLVANGTLAIELALRSLKIRGEVITTPLTFCATTQAVVWAGAVPIFVDVDPEHLTIDTDAIAASITPRTEAILAVHVYGRVCDIDGITKIAKKHGLAVIYDAAHAFNATYKGLSIGSFGDATAYSFHATKLFHTAEGGGVETPNSDLAEKIRSMRNFGIESEDVITQCGTNAKMSELSAAMGLAVLEKVGEEQRARAPLRAKYNLELANIPGITLYGGPEGSTSDLYYIIRVHGSDKRDHLQSKLRSVGILTRRYFYPLTSDIPLGDIKTNAVSLIHAKKASKEVLALPFHSGVSSSDVDTIREAAMSLGLT